MCGIYKIENLINGKVYIGKSINIQKRFKSHINDSFNENKSSYNHLIHKAIRKYGVENFSFDIIEQCDENELNTKEMHWISVYDCCILDGKDKGYNMTRGGDGSSSVDIGKIYELWDKGLSIIEISEVLHYDRHTVSIRVKEYSNYTLEDNKIRKSNLIAKFHQKQVYQYSLEGEFIDKYDSIEHASKQTRVGYRAICSNVQGKTQSAGGFQWSYQDSPPPGVYSVKGNGYKTSVVQLDLQYNFIQEFESLKDAAKTVGLTSVSSLSYAIKNSKRTVKGSHWMRKKDYDLMYNNMKEYENAQV